MTGQFAGRNLDRQQFDGSQEGDDPRHGSEFWIPLRELGPQDRQEADPAAHSNFDCAPASSPHPARVLWIESVSDASLPTEQPSRSTPAPILSWQGSSEAGIRFAELIHDTRNMSAGIGLYCDLLETPGALSVPFQHLAVDLRLVAQSSQRLLDRMALLVSGFLVSGSMSVPANAESSDPCHEMRYDLPATEGQTRFALSPLTQETQCREDGGSHRDTFRNDASNSPTSAITLVGRETGNAQILLPRPALSIDLQAASGSLTKSPEPSAPSDPIAPPDRSLFRRSRFPGIDEPHAVQSVANELNANYRILAALAGPAVSVGLSMQGGNRPIAMSADDLTRVLVNLTRNAADAMPVGGHLQIELKEHSDSLSLSFADTGSGIPQSSLDAIFQAGFTTRVVTEAEAPEAETPSVWPQQHRGLGLASVRAMMMAAGGSVWAANRCGAQSLESESLESKSLESKSLDTNSLETQPLVTGIQRTPTFQDFEKGFEGRRKSAERTRAGDSDGGILPDTGADSGAILTLEFPIGTVRRKPSIGSEEQDRSYVFSS